MLFLPHLFSGFSVGFCEANENAVITCATRIQEWTEWALSGGLFFPAEAMCVVGCVLIRRIVCLVFFYYNGLARIDLCSILTYTIPCILWLLATGRSHALNGFCKVCIRSTAPCPLCCGAFAFCTLQIHCSRQYSWASFHWLSKKGMLLQGVV